MPIEIRLDIMSAPYRVGSKDLAQATGVTEQNLSSLKQGRVKGIHPVTPEVICAYLVYQPEDLPEYLFDPTER